MSGALSNAYERASTNGAPVAGSCLTYEAQGAPCRLAALGEWLLQCRPALRVRPRDADGGAVAEATVLPIRIFGPVGVPLASIFMLVMGNATSGGLLPPEFLPGW